jgi:hypothetical protein
VKNSGKVWNDGVCVYFNAQIQLDLKQKIVLALLNLFVTGLFSAIAIAILAEGVSKGGIAALIFAVSVIVFMGRYTLWNTYGTEEFIINTKTIAVRQGYGWFVTGWKLHPFRRLYCIIEPDDAGSNIGTVYFQDHNKMDIPVTVVASSIKVPIKVLNEMNSQLDFIFSIERLTASVGFSLNLN